jgi:hypothetical protein
MDEKNDYRGFRAPGSRNASYAPRRHSADCPARTARIIAPPNAPVKRTRGTDRSRRPYRQANRLPPQLEATIVRLKLETIAKKLKENTVTTGE